jgi:hypothetical protein
VGFLWLLGAIKGGVKHQSLNFYLYLMWWQLLFWLGAIKITQVYSYVTRRFLGSWSLGFLIPYHSCHSVSLMNGFWAKFIPKTLQWENDSIQGVTIQLLFKFQKYKYW